MSKIESNWLGGRQTADYLNVTTMTIWRWERDPKLSFPKPTVINDRKYWARSDINDWMRRQATGKAKKFVA
jgi:predicted DNA-binding transcriptional regulator AlpA